MATVVTLGMVSCKPNDAKIKSEIEAKLKTEQGLEAVTVDVQKAAVTLAGTTDSDGAKATAETDAKAVKGVESVANNITVNAPTETVAAPTSNAPIINADSTLIGAVKDATKDFAGVKAEVKDGIVTLTGEIQRADLPKLMQNVSSTKPKQIEKGKLTIK
ncbi:MAG: transport-associated protein [Pseudopedobacter saltans]|uniref:Transport-associated protein n=1 Tax=Pseudopedobacter saltans TaxID=151895 RepID=A0A2W5H751_9SPHI|nr:MAG: transport-associated protein [Pseudopedobacter saltans]